MGRIDVKTEMVSQAASRDFASVKAKFRVVRALHAYGVLGMR